MEQSAESERMNKVKKPRRFNMEIQEPKKAAPFPVGRSRRHGRRQAGTSRAIRL
jgi:hypothetical protein